MHFGNQNARDETGYTHTHTQETASPAASIIIIVVQC